MPDATLPAEDACPPCRGTGSVISMLGGERKSIKCPWCDGSGKRRPPGEPDDGSGGAEGGR